MLPTDLLMSRPNGEEMVPKRLAIDNRNVAMAVELIGIFAGCKDKTQGELDRQLLELEGEETNYRIKRGLAHLLKSEAFSTFEIVSPLEPIALRQRVFALSAAAAPLPTAAIVTLEKLADQLSEELGREVLSAQIRAGLYADLAENRILTQFDPPMPEALLHRYNLSQVQGIFYKASQIKITAHRNDPGEYKLLFRYLKLFGLMAYIEGDADHGFTIAIDGPTSLFKPSTRYGLDIAKLIPALLHVSKWNLAAELQVKDTYTKTTKLRRFALDSECGLVSHYPRRKNLRQYARAIVWRSLGCPRLGVAARTRGRFDSNSGQRHDSRFSAGASRRAIGSAGNRGLLATGISPQKVFSGAAIGTR